MVVVSIPLDLLHSNLRQDFTDWAWWLTGFVMIGMGGLTAYRSRSTRYVGIGIAVTVIGLLIVCGAVWYHSLMDP